MGEYKYIQTYTRYSNTENFQQILGNFRHLLLKIGLSLDEIDNWLSNITWSLDDSRIGSVESILPKQNKLLELDHSKLNVRASIIIWTDNIGSYLLEEPWVELLVMVKLKDQSYTNDFSNLEKVLVKIMSLFNETFQETGVYITNEMQDGEAFIGLLGNGDEKLWAFDCAIIPLHYYPLYENVPKDFRSYTVPHGKGYVRKN
ncbi:hypothetical protein JGK52_22285 [Cytobacillus oceanisediminis]|uniref:hypothetical protein n=1 Tax=Cytobacillus oceanisediminis TaxID=665099 RepID=UPI001D13D4C0|nr:hypothetical protein [Cytobacillus oceanisediminis]MCC3649378.1 hypothetical protein [Cytobacillus oceanisediminis]